MNEWLSSLPPWQILATLGVLLMVAEMFVSGFVLLPIGVAFLLTALASLKVQDWPVLLAILGGFQVAMFWLFQKVLKKYHSKTRAYTGAEGMIGAECVVTEPISSAQSGYVKLYGDLWQARSTGTASFKAGQRVVITKIDGNKVFVEGVN